jgi:hypothetical protein
MSIVDSQPAQPEPSPDTSDLGKSIGRFVLLQLLRSAPAEGLPTEAILKTLRIAGRAPKLDRDRIDSLLIRAVRGGLVVRVSRRRYALAPPRQSSSATEAVAPVPSETQVPPPEGHSRPRREWLPIAINFTASVGRESCRPWLDGSGLARVFFTRAAVVGAAMCSAFWCGSHDRWP